MRFDYHGAVARVAAAFGLTAEELTRRGRAQPIIRARSTASWVLREMARQQRRENGLERSGPASAARARMLGYADHTTVLHLEGLAERNRRKCADYRALTDRLLAAELSGTRQAVVPGSLAEVIAAARTPISARAEARERIMARQVRPEYRLSPEDEPVALRLVTGTVLLERALKAAAA